MTGEFIIKAIPGVGISAESSLEDVTMFDLLGILEAIVQGFGLSKEDRKKIGETLAAGGPSVIPGVNMAVIRPTEELLRMMKEKYDETDEI